MSEEIIKEDTIVENLSLSFLDDGDLEISIVCTDPADLALLYYSVISGKVTEYFVESVKQTLDETAFQEFLGHLSNYVMIEKSDDPLISPSKLFERGTK